MKERTLRSWRRRLGMVLIVFIRPSTNSIMDFHSSTASLPLSSLRIQRIISCLVLLLAMLTGCASEVRKQPGTEGLKNGFVAEMPSYMVGDQWEFETRVYTVVHVKENKVTMVVHGQWSCAENCQEIELIMDRNLTIEGIRCRDGGDLPECKRVLGLKFLDFPLWVGKRWYFMAQYKSQATGTLNLYRNEMKVIAYEDVEVPAGKFKAFKIRQRVMNMSSANNNWYLWAYRWYAPEVGYYVKCVDNKGNVVYQLKAYKRAQ